MAARQITNGAPPVVESSVQERADGEVRELAVKQIGRERRVQARAVGAAAVSVVLMIIWAITEYNNAGGWPSDGFSQSSGIAHTWNSWIIYALIAIALGVAIDVWHTYRNEPITEAEIKREMDRLTGAD